MRTSSRASTSCSAGVSVRKGSGADYKAGSCMTHWVVEVEEAVQDAKVNLLVLIAGCLLDLGDEMSSLSVDVVRHGHAVEHIEMVMRQMRLGQPAVFLEVRQ